MTQVHLERGSLSALWQGAPMIPCIWSRRSVRRRSRALVVLALFASACRAPSPLPKEPPFDFDAHPRPTEASFSKESEIVSRWNDQRADSLRDFWNSGEAGTFKGVDGFDVAYRIHRAPNAKAAVVLLPGRTESIIKFAEVASDLVAQGYSNVSELNRDAKGHWVGTAVKNGKTLAVAITLPAKEQAKVSGTKTN